MEKKIIIDKLIFNYNTFSQKNFHSNQNFWQLFLQHQKMLDNETMECLFILNRAYEEMFYSARTGNFQEANKQLNTAHSLKNQFEFDEDTSAIFKIMTYPNIAYLQYKLNNIRSAQYYTKRTINLIKNKQYQDPIFLFRIIQQEINYAILYFDSNDIEKGINHSLKSIIECHEIIDNCIKNENYYENHREDTILLYNTNINVLAKRLCDEIKKHEEKLSSSDVIKWKLVERVTNLISV